MSLDDVEVMYDRPVGPARTPNRDANGLAACRFRRLSRAERDGVMLDALRAIEDESLPIASPATLGRWERGWQEVLDRVKAQGASRSTLRPQYFKYDVVRLRGDYAKVEDRAFEFELYRVFANLLFDEFVADAETVVDVCCGTGLNLLEIGLRHPGKRLIGYDWARPSQALLKLTAEQHGLELEGHWLDLWTLDGFDRAQRPSGKTVVITTHGLEQVGSAVAPFFALIDAIKPERVVHIEPLVELYDGTDLFDALALRYHQRRGYLSGLLAEVRRRDAAGTAQILKLRRLGFGSPFHEGYSILVWKYSP